MKDLRPLIEKKQQELPLSREEIHQFVQSLTSAHPPPDYQIASLLAFIFCRGLTPDENIALTQAMRDSGQSLDRSPYPKEAFFVDKHSTGGVGDKISLPLAPWVIAASENVYIPMIAGKGLGHTGGTIDKLESIPGLKTQFDLSQLQKLLLKHRFCFSSQSKHQAPADGILYALRDVTGTVASVPLIVASILSKKLSESLDYLLLDVKFGDAAFMQSAEDSEALALRLCEVARGQGVLCDAYQTNMQSPLGHYSGNLLEIFETEQILKGEGPADSTQLTFEFGKSFLVKNGCSPEQAEDKLNEALRTGKAFEEWEKIITAQGGKISQFRSQLEKSKTTLKTKIITAPKAGHLYWKARALGWALVSLGAGRRAKTDLIRPDVGLYHPLDQGARVEAGQEILRIYYHPSQTLEECLKLVSGAFEIREEAFPPPELIRKVFRDEREDQKSQHIS